MVAGAKCLLPSDTEERADKLTDKRAEQAEGRTVKEDDKTKGQRELEL